MFEKINKFMIILGIGLIIPGCIAIGIYFYNNASTEQSIEKPTISNENKKFETIKLDNFVNAQNAKMRFHMIDVGQADAMLLQFTSSGNFDDFKNTYNIMIDAGDYAIGKTVDGFIHTPAFTTKGDNKLKAYLDYYKLDQDLIDMFIFTHADADHIGGGDEVINKYCKPTESLVLNFGNNQKSTNTYINLLDAIRVNNLIYLDPELEQTLKTQSFIDAKINENCLMYDVEPNQRLIEFGNNWFSYIVPSYDYDAQLNETNESSINNYLYWNDTRFLFSGDSEGLTHTDLINMLKQNPDTSINGNVIPIDFYKVAHHGSITHESNNTEFLKTILKSDSKLLISQNDNKKFNGVPTLTEGFINNLINTNIQFNEKNIYTTQDVGDILIEIGNDKFVDTNFFSRDLQDKMGLWSTEIYSTNASEIKNKFPNFFM